MSIEDAYKPRVPVIAKLSKKGCISLIIGGKLFHVTHKHD
jgi:hypothetical protein